MRAIRTYLHVATMFAVLGLLLLARPENTNFECDPIHIAETPATLIVKGARSADPGNDFWQVNADPDGWLSGHDLPVAKSAEIDLDQTTFTPAWSEFDPHEFDFAPKWLSRPGNSPNSPNSPNSTNSPNSGKSPIPHGDTVVRVIPRSETSSNDTPYVGKFQLISDSYEAGHEAEPRPERPPLPVFDPDLDERNFFDENNDTIPNAPLAAIVIKGNQHIATEEIMNLIKTREGQVPDKVQIKEDIRTLVAKRWFFNVEMQFARAKAASGARPVLVFRVVEKPMLENVTYIGNKRCKDDELSEMTGLEVGGAFDVGANREAAHRIESHYRDKGYNHVKVELEKGDWPEHREVVFKIEEGPRPTVKKISFEGNASVPSWLLRAQVKSSTPIWRICDGVYDPEVVIEDVAALTKYYQDLGYFDVQVCAPRKEISQDSAHVHLKFFITEGERYKVRKIEFVGNNAVPDEELRQDMALRENEFFHRGYSALAMSERLRSKYDANGEEYFATVSPPNKNLRRTWRLRPPIRDLRRRAVSAFQAARVGRANISRHEEICPRGRVGDARGERSRRARHYARFGSRSLRRSRHVFDRRHSRLTRRRF